MYCRKCGENNPDNAVYCRNCGCQLKEEVKKTTVIETENIQTNSQQSTSTSRGGSDWMSCCLCVIVVFIVFAIFGFIFR